MGLHILQPGGNVAVESLAASPLASARMRLWPAARAALELNLPVTVGEQISPGIDILLVGKIGAGDIAARAPRWLSQMEALRANPTRIWVDYTDHHLASQSAMTPFYQAACPLADVICVPTAGLKDELSRAGTSATGIAVISDPLEYPLVSPKTASASEPPRALWFGHPSNALFLAQLLEQYAQALAGQQLTIVSTPQTVEVLKRFQFSSPPELSLSFAHWSIDAVAAAALHSDYCLIPSDPGSAKRFASNNRLVTALALGLPTIATALPSYLEVGTYFAATGTQEALELIASPLSFTDRVMAFQSNEADKFSQASVIAAWKTLLAGA